MEIERNWLIEDLKIPLQPSEKLTFHQGYISLNPEVRVKHNITCDTYYFAVKSKGDLTRIEVEKEITREDYLNILKISSLTEEDLILKEYNRYDLENKFIYICSVDPGTENEFMYGEIEFDSEEESRNFQVPSWFGKEVTYDNSYRMCNYWERTRLLKK